MSNVNRRTMLRLGARFSIGLGGGAFVLARTSLMTLNGSYNTGVPSEPSLQGAFYYWAIMMPMKARISAIASQSQQQAQAEQVGQGIPLPPGTAVENVSADGVPALLICAPGATKQRVLLYLAADVNGHIISQAVRIYAAVLSQASGFYVCVPNYRGLSPDHPFPAGLEDCLTVYRWLQKQGIRTSQVGLVGEYLSGSIAMAMALSLRDHKEPLPAALSLLSPMTDWTLAGESYATKASLDPAVTIDFQKVAISAYTKNGTTDVRNPLVSPLYADLHKLPPTLIQVGTQTVLLSDSTRIADRLRTDSVEVTLEIWPGMWFDWPRMIVFLGNFIPESAMAIQHIAQYMQRHMKN